MSTSIGSVKGTIVWTTDMDEDGKNVKQVVNIDYQSDGPQADKDLVFDVTVFKDSEQVGNARIALVKVGGAAILQSIEGMLMAAQGAIANQTLHGGFDIPTSETTN